MACHPNEISMLHAMFYTKSGQNVDVLMNVKDGAQEERISGGAMQPGLRLAATFHDKIRLNSVVESITQDGDKVIVRGPGFEFSAGRIIVALPPALAARIKYEPLYAANRDQLTQRIPMGTVSKAFAV